ncbi:MAG: hypothetical protein N2689_14355 [Verrucomicrobiae bacterium]|nr:hypothetical protein [Verrucomicrobiae bacterium]
MDGREHRWHPQRWPPATVLVPAKSADAITESGEPLAETPGVKFLRMEGDCAVREVEAGSYRFATAMK